ncbi:MAG: TlpA family protein disulfide reductase [Deltaproteobacteria bacterium]|nr:TlpA family protein disulfide reductase [Deltaproteobacteria bacterium]
MPLGAIAAAVVLALAGTLVVAARAAAARIGQAAPEFTLPDSQGRPVALAELCGQVIIVDFWASWCLPCAPMLPALDALVRRYHGNVRVLAIDIDQSRDKAMEFLRQYLPEPLPWLTILVDGAADVLARYGAAGMPAVFVVDADGTVRFVDAGFSPEGARDLEDAVRRLLPPSVRAAEQDSATAAPPDAGCTPGRSTAAP